MMYATDSKESIHHHHHSSPGSGSSGVSSNNGKPIITSAAAAAAAAAAVVNAGNSSCYSSSAGRFSPTSYRTSAAESMRRCMTNSQSREYGGGFLYGQPELFGSLGDGLLAARSEALVAAASGSGGNGSESLKPLRNHHDGNGFIHGHVPSSVSVTTTIQSAQNGRQHQMVHPSLDTMEMMEALSVNTSIGGSLNSMSSDQNGMSSNGGLGHQHNPFGNGGNGGNSGHHHSHHNSGGGVSMSNHPGLHGMYSHAAMANNAMMATHSHHHHAAAAAAAAAAAVAAGLSGHHHQHSHPHGHPHHMSMGPHHAHAAAAHAHQLHQHSNAGGNNSMGGMTGMAGMAGIPLGIHDTDSDPRELEAFAERFKQRRIKLGVTQADVGKALANLRLPGVGALSQSTICRFESLTLSHNNMIALKPILHAWLEEAEAQTRNKRRDPEAPSVLPAGEKKRKRTSIAAPEKRSLEAYFAVQPRPSGEKIAAIAEKLDLKKNVVRVWFCNQRQKQKRMKFAAQQSC